MYVRSQNKVSLRFKDDFFSTKFVKIFLKYFEEKKNPLI